MKAAITLSWNQGGIHFFLSQKKIPGDQNTKENCVAFIQGDFCDEWRISDEVLLVCLFFTTSVIDCNFGISALIKESFQEKYFLNNQGKHIICLKFLGLGIFLYITDGLQVNILSLH